MARFVTDLEERVWSILWHGSGDRTVGRLEWVVALFRRPLRSAEECKSEDLTQRRLILEAVITL